MQQQIITSTIPDVEDVAEAFKKAVVVWSQMSVTVQHIVLAGYGVLQVAAK